MKPNTVKSAIRVALGALSLGILTACGGASDGGVGDGGVGDGQLADGGIRGTGSSVGPVSGFGSVFVNGIRFETGGAQFEIDDSVVIPGPEEDSLQKGMILRIEGQWREDGTGNAQVVEYDDTFRGPVEGFSGLVEGRGTFRVLSQTIDITPQTVIRLETGVTSLQNGDFVRVSAWRDGLGYRASLIDVIGDTAEVEIEGPVNANSVDTDINTFEINGQRVQYTQFALRDGLTEADLLSSDGLIVEVEGSILQFSGDISATEVSLADDRRFQGTDGEDIEITGPVNGFTGNTFSINGIPVDIILGTTRFDDFDGGSLTQGLLVEVEGDFEQGRVQAREISLREGNAEVKGPIAAIPNPGAQTFDVGGVRVQVIPQTLIVDGSGTQRFVLGDLSAGEDVEVEGIELRDEAGDAFIQALKIEVEPETGPVEFELEGKLQALTQTTITALDVTIEVPGDSVFDDDASRAILQGLLNGGQNPVVEIEYTCPNGPPLGCEANSIDLD